MGKIGGYKALQELTPKSRKYTKVYKVCLRSDETQIYIIKTFARKTHSKFAYKEFELLSKLNNVDGIVKPYELFEYDGRLCIVEEYIEGICLRDYIKERKEIDCELCGSIVKRLLEILSTIHENGIVHRDIKPGNIVLRAPEYMPVVIDFDKALLIGDYGNKRTNVVGTPYYMAPELGAYYKRKWMLKGYDWRKGDVWSFGVTCYLLLHDQIPHKGVSRIFDFSDLLLFLTKCAKTKNSERYLSMATNCSIITSLWINLALECDWKIRHTFQELLQY